MELPLKVREIIKLIEADTWSPLREAIGSTSTR